MDVIHIRYPLYKQICLHSPKYTRQIQTHWDLMVNINNLVDKSFYGIMTDLQTVFLVELCHCLNNNMKRYLANKSTAMTTIKKMESNIIMYNNNIIYSNSRHIARYTPKIIKKNGQYRLNISDWNKRVKMYSFDITWKILPSIVYNK